MPHFSALHNVRRLAEDWSGAFDCGTIVDLYHHCKGTKGLCRGHILPTSKIVTGPHQYGYSACDLCDTYPDDDILMIVKIYNVRI